MPGLPAKPVIDVLLQVDEHWCLRRRGEPHDVNLHVYSPRHAAEEINRVLSFRDGLRAHDDDRDRYAATKRELSTRDWKYVQDYADAKTETLAKAPR